MGRFYETTPGVFVDDKMYQAPHELMRAVVEGKDKAIDTEIDTANTFYDKLKADVLEQDNPRAREIIKNLQSRTDAVIQGIQKNPLEYGKYAGEIRGLGRDIKDNWSMGEISTLEQHKKNVMAEYAKLDELHKKDPKQYDSDYVTREKANILAGYTGAAYNEALGKAMNKPDIQQTYYGLNFDMDEYLKQKMEADGYEREKDTKGGGYIYRNKTTKEILSPGKVAQAAQTYFNANEDIQAAVRRRGELGMQDFIGADVAGAVKYKQDENGNVQVDQYGNPILAGYANNWYGRNIAAAVAHKAYNDTKTSDTIHDDQGYWRLQQRAWDVADKEAENNQERVDYSFNRNVEQDYTSYGAFQTGYVNIVNGLKSQYNEAQAIASKAGLQSVPGVSEALRAGNYNVLLQKGLITQAKKDELDARYTDLRRQDFIHRNQRAEYVKWAAKKGKVAKYDDEKMYNQFINESGMKKNQLTSMVVSSNGIPGWDNKLQKEFAKTVKGNIRHMNVSLEGGKGFESIYENADGKKFQFIPSDYKIKQAAAPGVTVVRVPGGRPTVDYLIQNRLFDLEDATSLDDEETTELKFKMYKDGKPTTSAIHFDNVGVVRGGTHKGKYELGVPMDMGKSSAVLTFSTDNINSPSLRNWLDRPDVQKEASFGDFKNSSGLDQRNISVKSSGGKIYGSNKGRYYVKDIKTGVTTYASNSDEKNAIQRMIYEYAPYQQ